MRYTALFSVSVFGKLSSCQEYGNINGALAIVSGLANQAITRLTHTWEKLPKAIRKVFAELEALTDPSRNHRRYRVYVGTLKPPVIPYMPLLLKGITRNMTCLNILNLHTILTSSFGVI
jgi:hypothetical protein